MTTKDIVSVSEEEKVGIESFIKAYEAGKLPDVVSIPMRKLVEALHNGYEVIPDYKVNDFIVLDGRVLEIMSIAKEGTYELAKVRWKEDVNTYIETIYISKSDTRLATDEEVFWAKAGRGVWELKPRDILYSENDDSIVMVKEISMDKILFNDEMAVRYQRWAHINRIKATYKIACFAKDRLD